MKHENQLTNDQQDAIDHLVENDISLLVGGMGAGKTIVAATAGVERIRDGYTNKVLVTAPLMPCDTAWRKVWEEWSHLTGYTVAFALGSADKRLAAIIDQADFTIINHENLGWLASKYGKEHGYDGLIIDELSKFRSLGTAGKAIKKMKIRGWCVGLTGTPVSEDWQGFFYMCRMLDGGKTFGTRKDTFVNKYFYARDYTGYKLEPVPGAKKKIMQKLKPILHVMPDYTGSLPKLSIQGHRIKLDARTREIYDEMTKEMAITVEGLEVEAVNAAVLTSKQRQIAGGFVMGDEGTRFFGNEKLYCAINIIKKQTAKDGPIIVVYDYLAEISQLKAMYPSAPVLGDGMSRAQKVKTVEAFAQGNVPLLFMHPAAAGHGTDGLQDFCHTMIFLCPIWSLDKTDQVIARIWRRGQTQPCTVHTLIAIGTIDEDSVMPKLGEKSTQMPEFLELWSKLQ